jgi:hypothetical protein
MLARLGKRITPWLLLAAACAGAYGLGHLAQTASPALTGDVAWAANGPAASFNAVPVTVAGREAGTLRYGTQELLVIVMPGGGMSGYERAVIVANRINDQVRAGVPGSEINCNPRNNQMVVTGRNGVSLLTINPDDARQAGQTIDQLATDWTSRIRMALGAPALPGATGTGGQPGNPTAQGWQPNEPYNDRFVPILSVLQGVRIGIARVNGPQSAVGMVQAVAQLETKFENFLEIDVYVPVSTREPGKSLARVQSVGITGLGDLRL